MLNRREFILKIFRNASLLSLGLVSGYLIFRKDSDEVCDFDFVCRNCKKLASCSLPEAENEQQKLRNGQKQSR